MKAGEIYLAIFLFGDAPGMKLRPVLTLTAQVGPAREVFVAYISSVVPAELLPSDLVLDPAHAEHRAAKLKVRSVLRLHKLATIHSRSLARRLGTISSQLKPEVSARLRSLLML